jgi:S-adenosylmethionine decarboxylase
MKHILFTLKGCSVDLLDDEEFIRKLLYRTTNECKATLLHLATYKFDPQGVTGFAMLAESHISIHTWPEKGMAVCDVFTCGDTAMPEIGVEYMKEQLKATDIVSNEFVRPLE